MEAAHRSMAASPPQKTLCWRRLYTEASLLRALTEIAFGDCSEPHAKEAIALLDHILVVAGAPGEGRYDLVLLLISKIQTEYLPSLPFNVTRPDGPSSWPPTNISLTASAGSVPRLDVPPSFTQFQAHMHRQPFILPGYALDWPAMTDHPWQSFAYLRSVAGRGRVIPVEVGSDYRADNWTQQMMEWDQFLEHLENAQNARESANESGNGSVLYLAQHNLLSQFPSLRDDIIVPDYVYSCPPAPPEYPNYRPPGNDDQLVVNAWLGPKGTLSPAHTVSVDPAQPLKSYSSIVRIHTTTFMVRTKIRVRMSYHTDVSQLKSSGARLSGSHLPTSPPPCILIPLVHPHPRSLTHKRTITRRPIMSNLQ